MSHQKTIAADSRVRRGTGVVFQELDGEAVLVQLERGTCFTLDPIGTRIWQLIGEGDEVGRVAAALAGEFDVAPEVVERDLYLLLEELLARELLVADRSSAE